MGVVRCIRTGEQIYRYGSSTFFATGVLTYTYVHTGIVRLLFLSNVPYICRTETTLHIMHILSSVIRKATVYIT